MKHLIILILNFSIVCCFVNNASSALYNRGTGSSIEGTFNLIYDDDFDITWFDYINTPDSWYNQNLWTTSLEVSFNGKIYDDWRLPSTRGALAYLPDGGVDGVDLGYNCTEGEMGHLYYSELGNTSSSGLINIGDFNNLDTFDASYDDSNFFWYLETEEPEAWNFDFSRGFQHYDSYQYFDFSALAVMDGDVGSSVPEPASILLIASGIAGLVRVRRKR